MAMNRTNRNQDIAKIVKNKCKSIDNSVVHKYLSSYVKDTGLITSKFINNDHSLKYINKQDPITKTDKKIIKYKKIIKQSLLKPEDMIWKLVTNGSGNTWTLVNATKQDVKAYEYKSWIQIVTPFIGIAICAAISLIVVWQLGLL